MEKVYIVIKTVHGEAFSRVEFDNMVYADKAEAERLAAKIRADHAAGKYGIVPEDVFNRWPMDEICNSPIPHYKGYSYDQFKAQEERCEEWEDAVTEVEVVELKVKDAKPEFEKCKVVFAELPRVQARAQP